MNRRGLSTTVSVRAVAVGLVLLSTAGRAQEDSERVADLLRTVRRLENRVAELEAAEHADAVETSVNSLAAALEQAASGPVDLSAHWRRGLWLTSDDGAFRFHVGGRVAFETLFGSASRGLEDSGLDAYDQAGFRTVRLELAGTLHDDLRFRAEADFANGGDVILRDVWIGVSEVPALGLVRIGHFKQPFGLEAMTRLDDLTFLERSVAGAFAPIRDVGLGFHRQLQAPFRGTLAASVSRRTDDAATLVSEDAEYALSARLTGTPLAPSSESLLHLGLGYRLRLPQGNDLPEAPRLHSGPNVFLAADDWIDTGALDVDALHEINGEAAWVAGRFSMQAEVFTSLADPAPGSASPIFWGFYAYASLFLTEDRRRYDAAEGAFDRIEPTNPFGRDGGPGAWEIGLRVDHLDASDAGVRGGSLWTVTLGVNWYLDDNARLTVNYVFADLGDRFGLSGRSEAHFLGLRFRVDF